MGGEGGGGVCEINLAIITYLYIFISVVNEGYKDFNLIFMHEGYTFFSFFKILSDFSICCFFLDFVEIIRLELFGHHFVYQF